MKTRLQIVHTEKRSAGAPVIPEIEKLCKQYKINGSDQANSLHDQAVTVCRWMSSRPVDPCHIGVLLSIKKRIEFCPIATCGFCFARMENGDIASLVNRLEKPQGQQQTTNEKKADFSNSGHTVNF